MRLACWRWRSRQSRSFFLCAQSRVRCDVCGKFVPAPRRKQHARRVRYPFICCTRGRGGGVGRPLGVMLGLAVGVGVGVNVGVVVGVSVAVAVAVAVGVAATVGVGLGVGVGGAAG